MLKPVSILALDEPSAALAAAVQQRIAAACSLDDLVQWRDALHDPPAALIDSIHAQRQRPDSPLRVRDDISTREMILLVVAAAGPSRTRLPDVAHEIRRLYEMRRLAEFYSIELLCLLPDLFEGAKPEDYGATYALLKVLSDESGCDAVWLLDSMNGNRVKFGPITEGAYADAIAGALIYEPELSGALSGAFRPRGVPAVFSSFGYAELVFPRETALQRIEPRFASELLRGVLLRRAAIEGAPPALRAKQFVAAENFATPLSRIGVDAGQSLFRRFQPKTLVTEQTRNADELIAAVRAEVKAHRDTVQLQNLETLARQGEQTAANFQALLEGAVDETLDRDDYHSASGLLEALLDPMPDLRAGADPAPRNLVTEIQNATSALDARLQFLPNHTASETARKRVRELETLIEDQKLVADTLAPATAAEQLAEMTREKESLLARLPEVVFAEESGNNAARNTARENEAARLAGETETKEQQLRELFAEKPRAEHALAEAREERRMWLWKQTLYAASGIAALYAIPLLAGVLRQNLSRLNWTAVVGLTLFAISVAFRYITVIAPRLRAAREYLERIRAQIDATDKAMNAAHNDELQFEYDMAHRRATISVLRRTREAAKKALDALRVRAGELESLAADFVPASITSGGMSIAIIDDGDIDAWYERTAEDRKPLLREFPITRSQSRHMALDELRTRTAGYAAAGFASFRELKIAQAFGLVPEPKLAQRLKRFADYAAPLIELRDDLEASRSMQSDTTLWLDASDRTVLSLVTRRMPDAHHRPPIDPLRVHAIARVLHYPAYVLGQIDYYRSQYDAARFPESANAPDLLPTDLAVTGPLRAAYEQVLMGRAAGVIELRPDGTLASANDILGDTNLAAAQRLVGPDASALRERIEAALAPRLPVIASDLRQLAESPSLSQLERGIVGALVKRHAIS